MKQKNKVKGITLIALVITVIVLLILAGVAIAMLTGENGILKQATDASEESKIAEYLEVLKLIKQSEDIKRYQEPKDSKTYMDLLAEEIKKDTHFNSKNAKVERKTEEEKEKIIVTTKEGYIYEITENEVKYLRKTDEPIKTTPPNTFTIKASEITTTSITISGSTTDEDGAITAYYFSKDDGKTWEPTEGTTETSYKFSGLTSGTSYNFKMKAVDNEENETITETLQEKTIKPGNPDENGIFTETSTIDGGEKSATNPTIPAGFKPVNTTDASWGNGTTEPGATVANAGLVIEDKDENQFVWIPVDGTTLKYEKHTYVTKTVNDTVSNVDDTGNGNWRTYYYRNYSDWTDEGINTTSVSTYKGFYVGRYEAGIPSNANFYGNSAGATYYRDDTTPSKNVTTYTPVSKAKTPSWSCISQENAKIVSQNMYKGSNSVTSNLIDGYAWDTITTWMGNSISGIITDSTNYGNYYNRTFSVTNTLYAQHTWNDGWIPATTYSYGTMTSPAGSGTNRIELATGATDYTKIKNIYDMAGNMYEMTTEMGYHDTGNSSIKYRVHRGGGFYNAGKDASLARRAGSANTTSTDLSVGFRVVMYIK